MTHRIALLQLRMLLVLIALAWCMVPCSAAEEKQKELARQWSVGYWTPWGNPPIPPSEIEWGGLTHVIHAWALVQPDGSLDLATQRISTDGPKLIAEAHAHGVKVLLGIGQPYWLELTDNLPSAASTSRAALVRNIMNAMTAHGFDGIDIDWEPFDFTIHGELMSLLASDLRLALGSKPMTAAAIVTGYRFWGTIAGYFDRIGVMTYDLTGTWNPYAWHNSALYDSDGLVWSVDLAVKRFTAYGVPAAKLSIGIPFFGYQWTGGHVTAPRDQWTSLPNLVQTYYQGFAALLGSQNRRWDSAARVPYLSGANSFLTYDDEQAVTEKVNYARSKGLGGWIIWELSGDYLPSKSPNQPLLNAIKNAMERRLYLPVMGRLTVAWQILTQFREKVLNTLGMEVRKPQVSDLVAVGRRPMSAIGAVDIRIKPTNLTTDPGAEQIYVIGQVRKPGAIPLRDRDSIPILQALSLAEGLGSAAAGYARILRSTPSGSGRQEIPVDLRKLLAGKIPDLGLRANDVLFVTDNKSKKITLRAQEAVITTESGIIIWRKPM